MTRTGAVEGTMRTFVPAVRGKPNVAQHMFATRSVAVFKIEAFFCAQ